ncbi:hypothetical protein [Candidatus Poriferisocius sp.]|uniref:hypothetical protein n=1 Tax=Candidatus Poriferisocius sp. TaxID=3101276 RepID=UPI003B5AA643
MSIELTGGIDVAREFVLAERPGDPEMRDSVSMWVFDDQARVGLTRIGVEAVSANWERHGIQVNLAYADGRAYRLRSDVPSHPPGGADGKPRVLGAGPLAFECLEPFRTWTMRFDGQAVETSAAALAAGHVDGPLVDIRFEVMATMTVPPWEPGSLIPEAKSALETHELGLMGGDRYEQLGRSTGRVQVQGGPVLTFEGTALRVRRQGVRRLAAFRGHFWPSGLFADGRAFGAITYPPRDDGLPSYNEGFVIDHDGVRLPATIQHAAWLRRIQALGEDVSFVFSTPRGKIRISGETVLSTHDIHHSDAGFSQDQLRAEHAAFPALQQAGVRWRWDDVETIGMLERSSRMGDIDWS